MDEIKERHKKELAPYEQTKIKLTGIIMELLSGAGLQSAKTTSGTAFFSSRNTASVADGEAFMDFVINTGNYDLLNRSANATAVNDYITEHKVPPPGVNFTVEKTLCVRKGTKGNNDGK